MSLFSTEYCANTTKFEPTNHISARYLDIFHQILTKFGMAILLDPKNKSAQEFLIYRKIFKMAARGQRSKIDQI